MIRKRKMDSLLTIAMPGAYRELIDREAEARGVSLSSVVRDYMSAGMKAKGVVA